MCKEEFFVYLFMSACNAFPVVYCVQCWSCGFLFKGVIFKVSRSGGVLISFGNNALFTCLTDFSFNKYNFPYSRFWLRFSKNSKLYVAFVCGVYFVFFFFPCRVFYITWNSFQIFFYLLDATCCFMFPFCLKSFLVSTYPCG